jgi:predicted lactoylglutathione lyase
MKANQIYVNFPVKDVQKTRILDKAGFSINEQFSDDKAACVMINEGSIYIMFLVEDYFKLLSTDLLLRPILHRFWFL